MSDVKTEFTNNKSVSITFGKKTDGPLKGKKFIFDIERIINNYINIEKLKYFNTKANPSSKRYSFLDNYSFSLEYTEREKSDIILDVDYLDRTIETISKFIVLHTICKISPSEYSKLLNDSGFSYTIFIRNYLDYIIEWSNDKIIHQSVLILSDYIIENFSFLEELMIPNTNVCSVFEDFNFKQESEEGNKIEIYKILFYFTIFVLLFCFVYYIFIKK